MPLITANTLNGLNLLQQFPSVQAAFEGNYPGAISPRVCRALTSAQREPLWRYGLDQLGIVLDGQTTTDGVNGGKWFVTMTNIGTWTGNSTQAGYEGEVVSTTGATSGNTNSWIAYDGLLDVSNRLSWIMHDVYLPDPAASSHYYDYWLGYFNKQATPGATAPTDGFAWRGIGTTGSLLFTGQSYSNNTATALPSAGVAFQVNNGQPQSIQLGIVHQQGVGTDYWFRVPSKPASSGVLSTTDVDVWQYAGGIAAATSAPLASVVLRPSLAHITRSNFAHVMNMESPVYGFQAQNLR